MLPARCRAPRTARLAGFGHMNGYDLETQSWIGTNQVLAGEPRACRHSHELHRGILDAHGMGCPDRQRTSKRCAAGQWSMSLTRFGLAKLRAAVKAMLKQYEGAGIQMATQCRITSLATPAPKQIAILLAIRSIVTIFKISPRAPGCYR